MTIQEAIRRIEEIRTPAPGEGPCVYGSGRVTVDRGEVQRGVLPCPVCGRLAGMGVITVRHADGRWVRYDPRLVHYAEAGHAITAEEVDAEMLLAIVADAPEGDRPVLCQTGKGGQA